MPTIVHFDVPADDVARARIFYSGLFGWTFTAPPGFSDFYLIETRDLEGKPATGGGMGKRGSPDQRIMNYFGVPDIEEYASRVTRLGGSMIMPKTVVPGYGYLAICTDTEGNAFGLWQENPGAP
ncbi:MAG TPA: VOC family protein [Methanoregulaceae archaeon]|nr:VOC family protein [Methanoregulaceae archaeon]HQA81465.1 VOC family protein [Methanoregulaceae archaeon]